MLEKQMGQEEWSRMSEKDRQKKVRLFVSPVQQRKRVD